jgi:hypothetical protein
LARRESIKRINSFIIRPSLRYAKNNFGEEPLGETPKNEIGKEIVCLEKERLKLI